MNPEDYELIFDNGGNATLQRYDAKVVINYNNMKQLANDVFELMENESDPSTWDGNEPEFFISDE